MKDARRVLMVAATPFFSDRGCHIRIAHEAKHLRAIGIESTIATYGLGGDAPGVSIRRSFKIPWYRKTSPGPSWHKLYLDPLLALTVARAYASEKPDIIHAHLYEGLVVAWVARALARPFMGGTPPAPILFDYQGGLAAEMYEYVLKRYLFARFWRRLFSLLERALLKIPDAIVCSSVRGRDALIASYGTPKGRVDVVRDGFSSLSARGAAAIQTAPRRALDIPSGNKVAMYIGSMDSAKGVDALLDAVPGALARRPDTTFVFAGDGPLLAGYVKKYAPLVAARQVAFLGKVAYAEVPALLAQADLAVDPKKGSTESSGKLADYLAASIPIACADEGMARDAGALYLDRFERLPDLLSSPEIPRPKPRADFSWDAIVSNLVVAYKKAQEAAANRRRAPRRARSYAVGALVTVIFAALFFKYVSLGALFHAIASADPFLAALSAVLYAAIYLLRAYRLSLVSPVSSFIDNTILVSLHIFFGAILPARLGEASYPILIKHMHGVPYGKGISDLAYIRALDASNVLLVAPALIAYFAGYFGFWSLVGLLLAGEAAIVVLIRALAKMAHRLPKSLGKHAVSDWKLLWITSSISLALSLCMMAFGAALMSSLHVAASPATLVAGSALALIGGALPFQGLFGVGGIEAGWTLSLKSAGATAAASFAAGAGYHIVNFFFTAVFAAIAALASVARRRRHSRSNI